MSSSKASARAAIFLGALAVLAIPAGIAASRFHAKLTLLESLWFSVPLAALLALAGIAAARRARFAAARSVQPRRLRLARFLPWLGLYAAAVGGLALAVYGLLRLAE